MSEPVRILAVQNDDDRHAGRIGRGLEDAGAEIYRSTPELGTHPVRTTPAAQDDPLFTGIPAEHQSFHAHAFAFEPVEGATVLIESDARVPT